MITMDVIRINNVSKSFKIYKERNSTLKDRIIYRSKNRFELYHALDGVSLDIKKGETVGLLGRNGSGKSTLLKLLTGILYPNSGSIEMKGRVSSLLELGAGFHPDFTGRENIYMNASILGLNKREITKKLDEIIAFSELKEYIENPVRNYSSGMYMRLAFSVAIMVEPDILLIDEVLAVGDAAFQQKCMDQMLKLKRKGTTIVFVSHDLGAMQKLCDRVVWINKGKVIEEGPPRKIIDQYLMFLGDEENNRLLAEESFEKVVLDDSIIANTNQHEEQDKYDSVQESDNIERWGNRKIEICEVKILDNTCKKRLSFISGEKMRIELKYKSNLDVDKPVFGIGIFTLDHVNCYGTNTYIDNYQIRDFKKGDKGSIIFDVQSLDLVAGTYLVDVAAVSQDGEPYDYHSKKYSFRVSSTTNDLGIAKLKHSWSNIGGANNEEE
ncbi:ABC transporter ATP-binding protein [Brevibacillus sp. 179-C9.3 HS]|uniref:ABC transporter ATP-binding protein n=1 Tax=unclassified Brevibacillus TaxID=2684853 RepID=UPI0039A0C458